MSLLEIYGIGAAYPAPIILIAGAAELGNGIGRRNRAAGLKEETSAR